MLWWHGCNHHAPQLRHGRGRCALGPNLVTPSAAAWRVPPWRGGNPYGLRYNQSTGLPVVQEIEALTEQRC